MRFHELRGPVWWGDYCTPLVGGYARPSRFGLGAVKLIRTGPFVPPISLPDPFAIVSDDARRVLEVTWRGGLRFRRTKLEKVVEIHWHEWDRRAPPQQLPDGCPEHYFEDERHNRNVAEGMEPLWSVNLNYGALLHYREPDDDEFWGSVDRLRDRGELPNWLFPYVIRDSWNGEHIFWAHPAKRLRRPHPDLGTMLLVTDVGKEWLQQHFWEWVRFMELRTI